MLSSYSPLEDNESFLMPDHRVCTVRAMTADLEIWGSLGLPNNECFILILVYTSAEQATTINHHRYEARST